MNLFDKNLVFQTFKYTPHAGQRKLHEATQRFRILTCGSRWGKSSAGSMEGTVAMLIPDTLGWVAAPTHELADIIFSGIVHNFQNTRPDFIKRYSANEGILELINGAVCRRKSTDNSENLLGRGLDWLIFDECAKARREAWEIYLKARLMDKHGWALFTSTPKGKGWLWELWIKAKKNLNSFYTQGGSTWENTYITNIYEILQKEKQAGEWSQKAWEQEVLGYFIDDSGAVFKNVRSYIRGTFEEPKEGQAYSIGIDLAKHIDYTIITVMDMSGHVVFWEERPQGENWTIQKARIAEVIRKYNNATAYVDASGIGDPIVDDLIAMGLPIYPIPTAQQKTNLIDALVVAMESGKISYPEILKLINELETFESGKTRTGRTSYNAPEGMHDDAVISLSLAWRGVNSGNWGVATKGF